jgi:hypothetical protein
MDRTVFPSPAILATEGNAFPVSFATCHAYKAAIPYLKRVEGAYFSTKLWPFERIDFSLYFSIATPRHPLVVFLYLEDMYEVFP